VRRGAQGLGTAGVDASRGLAAARDATGWTCGSYSREGGECLLAAFTLGLDPWTGGKVWPSRYAMAGEGEHRGTEGRCLRPRRTTDPGAQAPAWPPVCHHMRCLLLTAPSAYDPVAFPLRPYEQQRRDGKLATSSSSAAEYAPCVDCLRSIRRYVGVVTEDDTTHGSGYQV